MDGGDQWLHGSVDPTEWPPDTPEQYRTALYGDRRQERLSVGVLALVVKVVKDP